MIELNIQVEGIDRITTAWAKRPAVVKKYMNQAIEASIFEIEKNAVDENFKFITPRSKRTGYLQRSFKQGIISKDLYGAIGPTVNYAQKVHRNNPFMGRIARVSQPAISKHFNDAMKFIIEDLK